MWKFCGMFSFKFCNAFFLWSIFGASERNSFFNPRKQLIEKVISFICHKVYITKFQGNKVKCFICLFVWSGQNIILFYFFKVIDKDIHLWSPLSTMKKLIIWFDLILTTYFHQDVTLLIRWHLFCFKTFNRRKYNRLCLFKTNYCFVFKWLAVKFREYFDIH